MSRTMPPVEEQLEVFRYGTDSCSIKYFAAGNRVSHVFSQRTEVALVSRFHEKMVLSLQFKLDFRQQ